MTTEIRDMTDRDLEKQLIGKSIIAFNKGTDTITLSDGTTLELESASDCCAWFSVRNIEAIDFEDNIITGVKETESTLKEPEQGAFDLVILSRQKEIARIQIDGDPTSGYYCSSVTLKVSKENTQ